MYIPMGEIPNAGRRGKRNLSWPEIHKAIARGNLHEVISDAMGDDQPKDAVDFSRQHADTPSEPSNDFFKTLRAAHPDHWIFKDAVATKKLADVLRDAQSAKQTTPQEDDRLRQTSRGGKFATKGPRSVFAANGNEDEFPSNPDAIQAWNKSRRL